MERGELIPDPDWQRGYIWGPKDEQLLIDSIIRGLPIPKFYLTREYDTKKGVSTHYAIDGQQRLKAIRRFLENDFPIEIHGKRYRFRNLDSKTQEKIMNYKLNGHYMDDYKQSDINFLFQRLNRTGIKLSNMEVWNNEYYKKKILTMVREIYEQIWEFPAKRDYRDYDDADQKRIGESYVRTIYTDENVKRMLPLDDITDLSSCLLNNSVEGGGKNELEAFLKAQRNISSHNRDILKSKFRKTMNNIKQLFTKQELEASAYSKRTHFISLFLAVGLTVPTYYILGDVRKLKRRMLRFIENPPEKYKESVLGAIRQKVARQKRVEFIRREILKHAKKLDETRIFDRGLKQKFWRKYDHKCQICKKEIRDFGDATLDHKEPWAKGGRTREENAQLAHKTCNASKRDKFEQFIILSPGA